MSDSQYKKDVKLILSKYNESHIHDATLKALKANDNVSIKKIVSIPNLPISWTILEPYITKDNIFLISHLFDVSSITEEKLGIISLDKKMEQLIRLDMIEVIDSLLNTGRIELLNLYIEYIQNNKKLILEYKSIIKKLQNYEINTFTYPKESIQWLIDNNINATFYKSIMDDNIDINLPNINDMELAHIVFNFDSYNIYSRYIYPIIEKQEFNRVMNSDSYSLLNGKILTELIENIDFCNNMIEFMRSALAGGFPYPYCYLLASEYMKKQSNLELKYYLLAMCMEHGYIDIIDKYMTDLEYISVVSKTINIHPIVIEYLNNRGLDISILMYCQIDNNTSPLWSKLLLEAIISNNVFLVASIVKCHKSQINSNLLSTIQQIYTSPEMQMFIKLHILK